MISALCHARAAGQSGTRDALTSDRLQITKYGAATEAAAQRFPQVSGLLKARSAPRLPLRSEPLTGSLFELCS